MSGRHPGEEIKSVYEKLSGRKLEPPTPPPPERDPVIPRRTAWIMLICALGWIALVLFVVGTQ